MATRQPPSPAVEPKNDNAARTCSTRVSVNSLPVFSLTTRSSTRRSLCAWPAMRRADGMIRRDGERRGLLHSRLARIRIRQHEARQAIGQRRLADAASRRRSARRAECARRDRLRAASARPRHGRTAPSSRADAAVVVISDLGGAHPARPGSPRPRTAIGAVAGSRRLVTTRQICSDTSSFGKVASISTQRPGSLAASVRKPSRSFS